MQPAAVVGGLSQGTYNWFKVAVAVIVFHFGVKMLVQFADILLPFIMALLLCTVLEPVKQVMLELFECTLIVLLQRASICGCCLRRVRSGSGGASGDSSEATPGGNPSRTRLDLHELVKRLLLLVSIAITVLLAGRLFYLVGRVVWLSGEAVSRDLVYYRQGVGKRVKQVQRLLSHFHLQENAQLDMEHIGDWAVQLLKISAEFLTKHVFYTLTQLSLTTIFVLFLLYSPVQRDFSPVMRVVFESMELYLKLKTFISVLMGITNGVALRIIGLELPAAWGLLTFLANFVPNIGGPVMSILPCIIALLDERKSLYQVWEALAAQFFLHFSIANFVEPVVFGTTEEIHVVVVLLGLSFFGYIWGFTGMFLSVPLLFAIHAWLKTVAQAHSCPAEAREDAWFVMGMLEGRWLANDDFGVEEVADTSLVDSPTDGGEAPAAEPREAEPAPTPSNAQVLLGDDQEPLPAPTVAHAEDIQGMPPPMPSEMPPSPTETGGMALEAEGVEAPQPPPISKWQVTFELQALFAVREAETDEVRLQGLVLRWVVLASAYIVVFFGFTIFHWDLHALIHPSGQPMDVPGNVSEPVLRDGADEAVGPNTFLSAAPNTTTVAVAALRATTTALASLAAGAASTSPTVPSQPLLSSIEGTTAPVTAPATASVTTSVTASVTASVSDTTWPHERPWAADTEGLTPTPSPTPSPTTGPRLRGSTEPEAEMQDRRPVESTAAAMQDRRPPTTTAAAMQDRRPPTSTGAAPAAAAVQDRRPGVVVDDRPRAAATGSEHAEAVSGRPEAAAVGSSHVEAVSGRPEAAAVGSSHVEASG